MKKPAKASIEVRGTVVNIVTQNEEDYICLTDIARFKDPERTDYLISNWMRNRNSDPVSLQRIVGGKLVALKPDESLESFQSNRPSPTFTGFLEHLRRDSALGVIPFEFAADSSKIGGAGVRLIVAKADRRFSFRQMILERRFIRPVWTYVIGDAISRGLLPPIAGWWKISSVPPRRVTVVAGREAQQNRADVERRKPC